MAKDRLTVTKKIKVEKLLDKVAPVLAPNYPSPDPGYFDLGIDGTARIKSIHGVVVIRSSKTLLQIECTERTQESGGHITFGRQAG